MSHRKDCKGITNAALFESQRHTKDTAMDMNKMTEKSQQAILGAQEIAVRMGHQEVEVEHLALALVRQEGGLTPRLLDKAGVAPAAYDHALEEERRKKPSVSGPGTIASLRIWHGSPRAPRFTSYASVPRSTPKYGENPIHDVSKYA